ncbi:MAG: DUF4369 domain-containing protein [Bacteroidaceae bacterium]|nr:DUF4369 domain-containing protein [Bacteroidaceae bacterium]
MRSFRNVAVSALAILLFSACNGKYNIQGTVDAFGYEDCSMSLVEFSATGVVVIDTCTVRHSTFQMNGHADSIRFVMLCKDGAPVLPMYLERGKTAVTISPTEMRVSGTRQNDLLYSFLDAKNEIDNRFDEMMQKNLQLVQADAVDFNEIQVVRDSLSAIIRECEDLIATFILDNSDERAAFGVFSMLLGPSDQISPLVKRILDSAPDDFLVNPTVAGYVSRIGYQR